jgi:hypothetical protein
MDLYLQYIQYVYLQVQFNKLDSQILGQIA